MADAVERERGADVVSLRDPRPHSGPAFLLHRAAALLDLALEPIASGRYHDRFERRDGQWRFVESQPTDDSGIGRP